MQDEKIYIHREDEKFSARRAVAGGGVRYYRAAPRWPLSNASTVLRRLWKLLIVWRYINRVGLRLGNLL